MINQITWCLLVLSLAQTIAFAPATIGANGHLVPAAGLNARPSPEGEPSHPTHLAGTGMVGARRRHGGDA